MTFFLCIITIAYLLLIGSFVIGFNKVKKFKPGNSDPFNSFSIIIPFRNEAKNLKELLESISKLSYPKDLFEVIMVNDGSNDGSERIISDYNSKHDLNIKVFNNSRKSNSPKKDAINLGILESSFDWIITTDADCKLPKFWLSSFDSFIQSYKSEFIVAPVTFYEINTLLHRFQILDIFSLQGATIGSFGIKKPFLCNGANLAYTKQLFYDLEGFEGNMNIASGDDIFLLEKAVKLYPEKVNYLKSEKVVVKTKAEPNLNSLINQRLRWAAKSSRYKGFGQIVGLLVFIMNTNILISLLFVLADILNYKILIFIFTAKFIIDFLLLFKTSKFFNQEKYLSSFIISSFLYPFFSVFIAVSSVLLGYKWKGTHFRK